MPQIYRTAISREDYTNIWQYIATDNVDAANNRLRRFDHCLDMLADHPESGRPRNRLSRGLRSFPVGQYVLFYRPVPDGIELMRVLHGNLKQRRAMFRS